HVRRRPGASRHPPGPRGPRRARAGVPRGPGDGPDAHDGDRATREPHRLVRAAGLPAHGPLPAVPVWRRALWHSAARRPAFRVAGKGTAMPDWVRVCATGELQPCESAVAWDGDTPILVVNLDGELYAIEDQCTHEDYELSAGAIDPEAGTIECVLHGAKFDLRDGRALCAPAYEPVAKFPVKVEDGAVW